MEVLLITGSTRGIGLCLAKYLKDKYKLIIHGRNQGNLEKAKKELGESENMYYICVDLLENPNDVIDQGISHYGKVDILINNAAVALKNDTSDTQVKINALVPYNLSKYAVSKGIKKIINVSSGAAISYHSDLLEYCLSKNLLESITKNLAIQYKDRCIVTGYRLDTAVQTEMTKGIYPDNFFDTLEDVKITIPLFLFLLKMGREASGRIYSVNRAKESLFLEKQFNNNFIQEKQYPIFDYQENKHVCNGENKFNMELGQYPSKKIVKDLETKIAEVNTCQLENITLVHGGISGGFEYLCRHFITNEGDEIICHTLNFLPVLSSVKTRGGVIKFIRPDLGETYDVEYYFDKIINEINPATKMIYLVHPTYIFCDLFSISKFEKLLDKVPNNIPVILDECYLDYFTDSKIVNSLKYIKTHFVFGLRTFSKMHGLASCRIGYIISNERYKNILTTGLPFKAITTDSVKCALQLLNNKSKLQELRMCHLKEKLYLRKELNKLKLITKGESIFLLIFLPENIQMNRIVEKLKENNVIIPEASIFEETIIYQIGLHKYNKIFINVLRSLM